MPEQTEFKNPLFLLLFIPYCAMAGWYIYGRLSRRGAAVAVSSERIIPRRKSIRVKTYPYVPALRFLALIFLIIALARPGKGISYSSVKNLGIDIMIALDLSTSMMGEDFQPKNRLTVAKQVVKDFIGKRKSDRLGLVVFAGDAYLQCPLTVEHRMILDIVDEVGFGTARDGTAIGDAIALATSRMMDSKGKSKVILLLTDGMNNAGSIDPETAAGAAAEMGIRIYTVGIGKDGRVPYPVQGGFMFGKQYIYNHFDGAVLQKMSEMTDGKYFRATSSGVLWENVKDIDRLEKSEVELKVYHEFYDKSFIFLMIGSILFFVEIILRSVFYRKLP